MECKYCKDEICVNADCPMCCDYCPVPDDPGVCRYEDRGAKKEKAQGPKEDPCTSCLRWSECNGVDEGCPFRR